jgi:hypothetical protein
MVEEKEQASQRETMKKPNEYENFDRTMQQLMRVPHSKIKVKLDAEKAAKKRKAKPSASRDSSDREGA